MSRGLGRLQRALFTMIRQHGKPMTFKDIRAVIRKQYDKDGTRYSSFEWSLFYSSLERSLRRALQRMVSNGGLIAIGGGGRADPFRYFIHPAIMAMACDTKEEWHAWFDTLALDPGANEALSNMFREGWWGE